MLIERTDITFPPGLPNVFAFPLQPQAGTMLWFAADQNVTLSGNNVTAWKDIVAGVVLGGGPSPRGETSANPVMLAPNNQNGLPSIAGSTANNTGTATSSFLTSPGKVSALEWIDITTDFSIAFAFKNTLFVSDTVNNSRFLFAYSDGYSSEFYFDMNNGNLARWNFTMVGAASGSYAISLAQGLMGPNQTGNLIITYKASTKAVVGYFNGIQLATGTSTLAATMHPTPAMTAFRFFGSQNVASVSGGVCPTTLFEFSVHNVCFTQAQATAFDTYLNRKWALHP